MKKILVLAALAACGHKTQDVPVGGGSADAKPIHYSSKDLPPGLVMKLSDGTQGPPAFDHNKLAPATKLGDAEVKQLLSRERPIETDAADQQAFALRPASQPPPRTGDTIHESFPPPASSLLPPKANDVGGDLKVLRYMPEGAVKLVPELTLTFSQPMVAVTSQSDAASVQPVTLTPTPKGKWRWIGTRTIVFDPDVRFPQATTYKVEVPAGTKSATGGTLKTAVKFQFETPAPVMVGHWPSYGPQKLDVPMFVEFDQKIDPSAVLGQMKATVSARIHTRAGSNDPWTGPKQAITTPALRLLTAKEIEDNKQLKSLADAEKKEHDGRWFAFRTTDKLPPDATIEVTIPTGTPSAEGPNKTTSAQTFSFQTYAPLELVRADCSYSNDCRPGMPFEFQWNNPLDEKKFKDQLVSISPEIPDVQLVAAGNYLSIIGMTKARTTYKVKIASRLTDAFGQTLERDIERTFKVGDAAPSFYGPSGMVVLDPAATKPTLDFFTTNYDQLKVKLYQVTTADLVAYGTYVNNQWNHDHPSPPPGKLVFDHLVKTAGTPNELVETAIDLAPALSHGFGDVVAVVEPYPWKEQYEPPRMIAWVQATHLAVDAHVDNDNLIAFATDLATGKPAANIEVEIKPYGIKATTDAKGLATLPLAEVSQKGPTVLTARSGEDMAFVTGENGYYDGNYGTWTKHKLPNSLVPYVVDDRKMYKPGEEVTLKGFLRLVDPHKGGDVTALGDAVTKLDYRVTDATGNEIAKGAATVDAAGGFDTKFTLPKTPNLGYASVTFTTSGALVTQFVHPFQIQEFRRPEFEVSAQPSQGPFLVAGGGDVTVSAKYYSGGPLPGADVTWSASATPTVFTPPNRDDYTFGNWQPWWGYTPYYGDGDDEGVQKPQAQTNWSFTGKTDALGEHVLHMDYTSVNPAVPMSVSLNASVFDVNRQAWNASSTLIVHPSTYYVGVKTKKPFVEKGKPFDLDVIGVDLDGKIVAGAKIDVKAVRLEGKYKKGRYTTEELDPQTCSAVAAKDPSPCEFQTTKGGTYQVTATIVDPQGRPNQTKMTFWVTGGDTIPAREVSQEVVQIIPDKKEYAAGNTAELLVQAPFYPAQGLVTWRRSGIVKIERVDFDTATKVITVPIDDAMTPNMYVQVDLVGNAARLDDHGDPDPKLPKRPAYAVGSIDLPVPPRSRTLKVQVAPRAAKVAPGEADALNITVTDAAGKPVPNAEVAVLAVDEAVLALSGYQFDNPVDTFYAQRPPGATDTYLRSYVKLAKPDITKLAGASRNLRFRRGRGDVDDITTLAPSGGEMDGEMAATGTAMALDEGKMGKRDAPMEMEKAEAAPPPAAAPAPTTVADAKAPARAQNIAFGAKDKNAEQAQPNTPIAIRTNFNPLAAFAPAVKTGPDGNASVEIKLPDNLTRYRVVAIAVAGDKQFGKGESALTARLPLMVRPSPPRFLNFGDTFELPVVVQNQTDAPMTVRVAARTANISLTDGAGRELAVPPNDRVEVRFPASAMMAGTARLHIVGAAGNASDAAELSLPVWTPATTEAFATYGVIDNGAMAQPVALPGKVWPQFGGLEVTTASTNLQALTDAMLYLVHYPFECAEQRSSRIMAIAALRDVLSAFKTKDMPSAAAMEGSVVADLEHLQNMQNYDGGFAFWDRGHPSEPYLTVFVANALAHAKAKGFAGTENMLARASNYLKNIENYYPWYYGPQLRWAISAYALQTRKLMGDLDIEKGQRLLKEAGGPDKVTMETNGWLLSLFAKNPKAAEERQTILRYAMNHVSETAGAANFTTSYGDGAYLILASDRRVDGVMLEALIEEQPDSDLIPKIVTGLLAHRTRGRWENTQENTFALLALDLYFHTYEKVTPDFVARVWLGNDYAGDHTFKGRTTEYAQIDVAMKDVATHDKAALTIQKDGAGRLYYRIGMKYAPEDLKLEPADYGFVVERKYEGVDKPTDVTRAADGTWHVKAGSRVRVKLTMVNENRRYHVALVDPMPAGFEAMNPALAVTGPVPTDPNEQKSRGAYWWWYGTWYEHQNMRDERVEAFTSLLWEGVHDYSYVARATTPGNFVVPPPKAEEMYMPETFGRGGSDRVIVE